MRACRLLLVLMAAAALVGSGADAPPPPPQPAATAPPPDQLYDLGKALFDQYAPPEIKAQYEFPSRVQWDDFATKLQRALEGDSFGDVAAYEPQARAALAALRTIPGYEDYADWMQERLDLIQAAGDAARPPPPPGPAPEAMPVRPAMPYYRLWLQRLRNRPAPADAGSLMPELRAAFAAEGVPPDLAWMAEVESSLNPRARSPAGARGLFQLMPQTAEAAGLSTFLPDERTDPEKSAQAAARILRGLHERFGDWPLALAAYNAGAGRVDRALAARHARTFAEAAPALPVETRLYVPKVYATIAVRTGGEGPPP